MKMKSCGKDLHPSASASVDGEEGYSLDDSRMKTKRLSALKTTLAEFLAHGNLFAELNPKYTDFSSGGKSAIIAASTIVLGAKTVLTGRVSKFKGLVNNRSGATKAEVTIQLNNYGPDGYKADVFGNSMFNTRKLGLTGSSDYVVANFNNKTIEKSVVEIKRIAEHLSSWTSMKRAILETNAYIPELEAKLQNLNAKCIHAGSLEDQGERVGLLNVELGWGHVEDEKRAKIEERDACERKLVKVKLDLAKQADAELKEDLEAKPASGGHLQEAKDQLQAEVRKNKKKLQEFQNEERTMDQSLLIINRSIADLTSQVDEEKKQLSGKPTNARAEFETMIEAIEDKVASTETDATVNSAELAAHEATLAHREDRTDPKLANIPLSGEALNPSSSVSIRLNGAAASL
ncbi:Structural maintenance of chromosomes protein 6 [Tulasnella sp. 332]|nr:Structural maintenance of chromosomes protein 6 [Tulasnella sp. 332]